MRSMGAVRAVSNRRTWLLGAGLLLAILAVVVNASVARADEEGILAKAIVAPITDNGVDPYLTGDASLSTRKNLIPVRAVDSAETELRVTVSPDAGREALGFVVEPGQKISLELTHPYQAWFELSLVDRFGRLRAGMLNNLIARGNQEVFFANKSGERKAVYLVVTYPEYLTRTTSEYSLAIRRSSAL